MSNKSPSYITKSLHGVYYFQIRIDKTLRNRLKLKGKLYRKSLRTKDKATALKLARKIWVKLYADEEEWLRMSTIPTVGTPEYDSWEEEWKNKERLKSKNIRIALDIDNRLNAIPNWDFESREIFIDGLSPEEQRAIQYVSDNNIILDEFRDKTTPNLRPSTQVATKNISHSRRLSRLLEEYLNDSELNQKSNKTIDLYKNQIEVFIELVTDIESSTLQYDDVRFYKKSLPKIPRNKNKKSQYKNISLRKLIKMNISDSDLISSSSCNTYSTNVKAFLSWCSKRKFISDEVLTALDGAFKGATKFPYLAFTDTDLKKLFLNQSYMGGKHSKASH